MPRPGAAGPLLAQLRLIREQIEGLDDPQRATMLLHVRQLAEVLEAAEAREKDETARAASGIGAAPRFTRWR